MHASGGVIMMVLGIIIYLGGFYLINLKPELPKPKPKNEPVKYVLGFDKHPPINWRRDREENR